MLQYNTRLGELDDILALATRMTFSLERFTSTEAPLALVGLILSCQHILRSLT